MKIDNLNALRAFAILLVVLRHCFSPYTGAWPVSNFYDYNLFADILGKYITTISMPLFVFISGFLFSYLRNTLKKYPNYLILIQKKTARLIRPYIFLAPLYIVLFLDFETTTDFLRHLWKGAGHLWFLLMIFSTFIMFYPLENFLKKYPFKSFLVVIILFFLFPGFSVLGLYPLSKAFQYLPFFFVGYFFHYKSTYILEQLKGKIWLLLVSHTLIFIVSLILPKYIENGILSNLFRGFILLPLGLISVSLLYLLFTRSTWLNTTFSGPLITNINETSYYIYILHQPLLMWFFEIPALQTWPPVYVILLGFLSIIPLSLILSNFLIRFHWGRKLIGAS